MKMVDLSVTRARLNSQEYKPTVFRFQPSYLDQLSKKEFSDGDLLELFHENTKYKHDSYDSQLGRSQTLFKRDPGLQFAQANVKPDYPTEPLIELPEPGSLEQRLDETLLDRHSRREMTGEPFTLEELSTLLKYGCGTNATGEVTVDTGEETETAVQSTRTYPSGGALYPVEIYLLVTQSSNDLDRGLYYYTADRHGLRVLDRDADVAERAREDLFDVFEGSGDPSTAAVTFVLTGHFWRARAKYGPRAYRNVLQESGHLAQNVLLAAEAMDKAAVPLASYRDDEVNEYLGIDGTEQAVLYAVSVGERPSE